MTEKYLLNTQIWIDHYLERIPHGEAALKLILKIIAEDSIIIFTNFIQRNLFHITNIYNHYLIRYFHVRIYSREG